MESSSLSIDSARQSTAPFYLVSGTVRSASGSLEPAFRLESASAAPSGSAGGTICIDVESQGARLSGTCFGRETSSQDQPFVVRLPFDASADRIVLRSGSNELDSISSSPAVPTVAITSPRTGSVVDASSNLSLNWAATDGDGDALVYVAQYSSDGGASWLPLAVGLSESSMTFDPSQILGGDDVFFRVLASDGFHTASDTVGPVAVDQTPSIVVGAAVGLGSGPVGRLAEGRVPFESTGSGPLLIQSASTDNPNFRVASRLPIQVAAGDSSALRVEFQAVTVGSNTSTLVLTTNDPSLPTVDVSLNAVGLDPEQPILLVGVDSGAVGFGDSPVAQSAEVQIPLVNQGAGELHVEVTIDGEAFSFGPPSASLVEGIQQQDVISIAGGQQFNLPVIFEPTTKQEFVGRLVLASDDQNQSRVEIALSGTGVEPQVTPAISSGGVVDAAQFQAAIAPGGIGSIFGSDLAADVAIAGELPLPFELGETHVRVDGWEAPLFFESPNQINFQVPFEVTSPGQVDVVISRGGLDSPVEPAMIAEFAPAVFLNPATAEPIIQRHPDGALITATNPAKPGDVLIIFVTGIGGVSSPPVTGAASAASPLASARVAPTVTVAGESSQVFFAGLAPFFVGLGQVNIQIANTFVPNGPTAQLVIDFEGSSNPPVSLPVPFEQ